MHQVWTRTGLVVILCSQVKARSSHILGPDPRQFPTIENEAEK